MELINLALWIGGIALLAIGYSRARGPMSRYQSLKQQDANVARYEAWRGGARDRSPTGASVQMQLLRRQASIGIAIAVAGFILLFVGFLVR